MPDLDRRGERLLVAHDLPAPVSKIAEDIGRLGDGWYVPRDEGRLVSELLERVGSFALDTVQDSVTVVWVGGEVRGRTVTEALMAAYQETKR